MMRRHRSVVPWRARLGRYISRMSAMLSQPKKEIRWEPWQESHSSPADHEIVTVCALVKVYLGRSWRNAYRGNLSTSDEGSAPNLSALKRRIEGRRTQGTQFQILEAPAIAVGGIESAIFIFGWLSAETALQGIRLNAVKGKTLRTLVARIMAASAYLQAYITDAEELKLIRLPFARHHSAPNGMNESLYWKCEPYACDVSAALELCSHVCVGLSKRPCKHKP